ncbi:hypothetical protein D1007_39825 [Hordeum vulgare]|nr:hypothetical protein D1007_39825 [Hordeum vulgare]
MDVEANPTDKLNPLSPHTATEDVPSPGRNEDDITIIEAAYTAPKHSIVLTKLAAKNETSMLDKGKGKLELPGYVDFSAEELHAGFLSRLSTSWDMEAILVNMMKRKYEVYSNFYCLAYIPIAPKVHLISMR